MTTCLLLPGVVKHTICFCKSTRRPILLDGKRPHCNFQLFLPLTLLRHQSQPPSINSKVSKCLSDLFKRGFFGFLDVTGPSRSSTPKFCVPKPRSGADPPKVHGGSKLYNNPFFFSSWNIYIISQIQCSVEDPTFFFLFSATSVLSSTFWQGKKFGTCGHNRGLRLASYLLLIIS